MNDIQAAKALGWFSVGLGAAELVFGARLNRALGLGQSALLVRAFGAREVAAGAMTLMRPGDALPIWLRLGGDALDLGVLAGGLASGSRRRDNAALATLAVLGVTAADALTAVSLSRRRRRALATSRRGRVRAA